MLDIIQRIDSADWEGIIARMHQNGYAILSNLLFII
jgi:hypothetical protein